MGIKDQRSGKQYVRIIKKSAQHTAMSLSLTCCNYNPLRIYIFIRKLQVVDVHFKRMNVSINVLLC